MSKLLLSLQNQLYKFESCDFLLGISPNLFYLQAQFGFFTPLNFDTTEVL